MATPIVNPPKKAVNISEEDQKQFNALWKVHTILLSQGKVVYYIPLGMALQLDPTGTLKGAAHNLSAALSTDIYVHFDANRRIYRLGQIFDEHDRNSIAGLTCYYYVQFTPGQAPAQAPAQVLNPNLIPVMLMATSDDMPSQRISKPANSWILYRKSKHHAVQAQNPGLHTSHISQIIGQMWQSEPQHVKDFWKQKAHEVKAELLAKHPNYRPQPRKSSSIKRRKTSRKATPTGAQTGLNLTMNESSAGELLFEDFNVIQPTMDDVDDSHLSAVEEHVDNLWGGVNQTLNAQGAEHGSNTAWLDDGSI